MSRPLKESARRLGPVLGGLGVTKLERFGLSLTSAFQPIVSVVHEKVVGYEALLRGCTNQATPLSPFEIFSRLEGARSAAQVSELCLRLHLRNFLLLRQPGWLFVNLSPAAISSREQVVQEMGLWLEQSGVEPHRVVAEIVETQAVDERRLTEAVFGLRDLGCLVAIDDFGAGESNFERVWRLRPDIVKLDRKMIVQAAVDPVVQRGLPGVVSLMHEAGCLVVIEGIENEHQALVAVDSNADFVQGYLFGRPASVPSSQDETGRIFVGLGEQLRETREEKLALDQAFFAGFFAGLEACASSLEDGFDFSDACAMFLAVAGVQRVYELDEQGRQVWDNIESPRDYHDDRRFLPCADAKGANWSRRSYFRQAISHPGIVQACRPYLSIRDARPCVTISLAFKGSEKLRVLCADLDVGQAEPPSYRRIHRSTVIEG